MQKAKTNLWLGWSVSHCDTTRDQFVDKLLKFIDIDIYGQCSAMFGQENECEPRTKECSNLLKRYKFYLSFENGFCVDYITEKYWSTPLDHDMVPVVLGGAHYDSMVAVPGSYINLFDFQSIKALADYLIFLDKNDVHYNKFFKWKKNYKIGNPECWTCNICAAANDPNLPSKVYDLSSFWGVNTTCNRYSDRIAQMLDEQ
jgi:galactoside alpha-1,3-fucosyltransferase 4